MKRQEKIQEVASLKEGFLKAKAVIFANYSGLKVSEVTELRRRLKSQASAIKVVKNRLLKRALDKEALKILLPFLAGPTAVAFASEDPVPIAKVLVEYAKDHEALKLKGGFLVGGVLSPAQLKELSRLPGRQELYAKFLGSLAQSASRLVGVLAAVPRKLVLVMDAVGRQRQ